MSYISTSALAKGLSVKSSNLFQTLTAKGLIERKSDQWDLIELGTKKGGETKINPKFGEYIVWS